MARRALAALLVSVLGLAALTGTAWLKSARAEEPRDTAGERERRLSETYRKMLAEDPAQAYAFRRLLETSHAVGGLSGLIAIYREELERDPQRYASWLVLGQLHRAADHHTEALACWERAAALRPERAEPHLFAAALHRHKRAFPEALRAYERGLALLKDRAARQESLRAAAETAIEARALDAARDYFERLNKTEPGNIFLRMQEAATWGRLDQPERALERWREVEKAAGGQLQHLVVIWPQLAALETELGQLSEAEATWRRGLARLPPGHYERRTFLEGLVALNRRRDTLRALLPELAREAERDAEALVVLARLHEELGEDTEALACYREAQRRRPGDEEVRMAALRLLERSGSAEELLQAWAELLRAFPREARYQLRLAEAYFHHGRAQEAGDLLRKISRAHPRDPSVHIQLVDLWMRYGDRASRSEVEAEYKLLMKLEPDEPAHVVSLGEYYWSIEDKARALTTWQRLQKLGGRRGEGDLLYAEALAERGMYKEARAAMEAALAQTPEDDRVLRSMALLLERAGWHDEALKAWQKVIDRGLSGHSTASTREAREHIIGLWERGRRLNEELAQLSKRFAAEPVDIAAGRFLTVALLRVGRLEEARVALERLDALVADDHETLTGLERVYTRLGDTPRLWNTLERLAATAPTAATEYLHRAAELALGAGDDRAALKLARRLVELAPTEAQAHTRVGELYLKLGLESEAAEAWRRALSLNPRDMAVHFKLAGLYRAQGLTLREEQLLTSIVREATQPPDLTRAGRRLLQVAALNGRLEAVEVALRPLIEAVSRPDARGRNAQLRLVLDLYGQLAQAARSGPPEGREERLRLIGERAQRPIIQALEDADLGLRAKALDLIGLTRPAAATAALGRIALDSDQGPQLAAVAALGQIGSDGAVQILARLSSSPTPTAREMALWSLGQVSSPQATALLVERARRGPVRERLLATLGLGYGRHTGASEALIELASEAHGEIREAAVWALGRISGPAQAPTLATRLSRAATPREALLAASGLVRIAQAGHPAEPRAALVAALWEGNRHLPDDLLWDSLAELELPPEPTDEVIATQLYRALVGWERNALSAARPALLVPPPRAAMRPPLAPDAALGDPLAERLRAVLSGRQGSLPALARAMALGPQPTTATRGYQAKAFAAAFEQVRARSWDDVLAAATDHTHHAAVWTGLSAWPPPPPEISARLAPRVLAALTDTSSPPETLKAALTLYPRLVGAAGPDPAAVKQVIHHSRAPQTELRAESARVLAAWGHSAALPPLLSDASPLVRIAAATAIAAHKVQLPREGLEALVELSRDPLPEAGVAAVGALLAQPGGLAGLPQALARRLEGAPPHIERALSGR